MRRRGVLLTIVLLTSLAITEIVLRGLGRLDHPLFVADPRYEYLMRPDQDVWCGPIHYVTLSLIHISEPTRPY